MYGIELKDHLKSMIPESVLLGQLVLRRTSTWRRAGMIFVHVPKNGGTSINAALYGRFMGHFRVRDIDRFRPGILSELPSLAVTRNPWARAYSAWNFARKTTKVTDEVRIRHAEKYRGADFSTFERFVLEWLPARDLSREDYVFRPQTEFLLKKCGDVGVTHLGRIEEFNTYLPFLEETLGRHVEIGHLNQTVNPVRYRDVYTPPMRNSIADCYADDLERFNYDF